MSPEPLSARNPRVARLARLVRRREERDQAHLWVVEGPVLVGAALEAGRRISELYVDAGSRQRPGIDALLDRLALDRIGDGSTPPMWELPAGVLDRIGDVSASQGVLGLVRRPEHAWPSPTSAPFVLVLAELADPGNVGTLVRTAAAAGAAAVVCIGGVDAASPKVVRSSAGAVFSTPVLSSPPPVADVLARLRGDGYRIATTVARGGEPHHGAPLEGPLALVLGNEARGLDPAVVAAADVAVTIALAAGVESLNVAAAAAVLCFEVARPGRLG